jgi:hypothetical protein
VVEDGRVVLDLAVEAVPDLLPVGGWLGHCHGMSVELESVRLAFAVGRERSVHGEVTLIVKTPPKGGYQTCHFDILCEHLGHNFCHLNHIYVSR